MSSYSELLKSPEWQKKRLEVLTRDNFTCQSCFDNETQLHVHHKSYVYGRKPWEYHLNEYLTLCSGCHEYVTEIKKEVKLMIDNFFNETDCLSELSNIMCELVFLNPGQLNNIHELITKYKVKNKLR